MTDDLKISFEFFPPSNRKLSISLWKAVKKLSPLNPEFVSVTYGAGGGTRNRTHKTIKRIKQDIGLVPAPHLTCVSATKEEIRKIAKGYYKIGVKHIVALRGDISKGYNNSDDEFKYASDLIYFLKKIADFKISTAGYPEKHPEASNIAVDIDNLKRKIDAGASQIITQFCFDNNKILDFLNLLERKSINVPVIIGVLPVINFLHTVKFAQMCNTSIPKYFYNLFDSKFVDRTSRHLLAAHVAIKQCQELQDNGIKQFHFYTLNRAELSLAICHILEKRKINVI